MPLHRRLERPRGRCCASSATSSIRRQCVRRRALVVQLELLVARRRGRSATGISAPRGSGGIRVRWALDRGRDRQCIGPKNGQGPPTETPRAAQDRQRRFQGRPKTANMGPQEQPGTIRGGPRAARSLIAATRAAQDCLTEAMRAAKASSSTSRSTLNRKRRRRSPQTMHAALQLHG